VARTRVLDLRRERTDDRRLDALEPMLEIDGRNRGLEHGSEHIATSRDSLELVRWDISRKVQETLAETQLLGDARAALPRDDVRAYLRKPSFRGVYEAVEHRARDRELEHAVAEELEALVRLSAVFGPRCVSEDLREQSGRKLFDQAAELVRPGLPSLSPGVR
jgi:phosphoenolpyruvate carboxylase